jgi:hypothetical protein
MAYVVDQDKFKAEAAYLDWAVVARRLGYPYQGANRYTLQIRWMIHRELGLPTEPFIVWRRPKGSKGEKALKYTVRSQGFLLGNQLVEWTDGPMLRVFVEVDPTSTGTILAYTGSPIFSNFNAIVAVNAGSTVVQVSATSIDGLVVSPTVVIKSITGIPVDQLSAASGWEKFEYVGLPVPVPEWNGIAHYAAPQGMVAALTTPQSAALQRLERGAPQVGWQPTLPTGEAVPPWTPPNTNQLVTQEIKTGIIDLLKKVLPATPPNQQYDKKITVVVPPPENSSGKKMPVSDSTTEFSPLAATLMPAGVDPWLALSLGFGTAYPVITANFAAVSIPTALSYDYMITARWEKGLDGNSQPYEMAAMVPSPPQALAPPAPANLYTEMMGNLRPLSTDADWRCSVKVTWDRPADLELIRPRTYAVMRSSLSPAEPVRPLMNLRPSGGYKYGVINSALPTPIPPDWWQISDVDRELPIPANPGSRQLRYGVAQQDIYGQWSVWSVANSNVTQPPVDHVRIVTATLSAGQPATPNGTECPGTLTIEFLWDWRVRSPRRISFVGRLYAAAHRGDPPPITSVPGVLERKLNHTGSILDLTFTGESPDSPAVQLLSEDGQKLVATPAQQGNETRRYRVTLTDFTLDFASTGHIGLALWAMGQERILPQRQGAWSNDPSVISVSDPRPPKMIPDIVTLASLPDAAGECHARLTWNTSGQPTNAVGYFIYESTESKLLMDAGLPEPPPEKTLSERLTTLKQIFRDNPAKWNFTRRNDRPIQGNNTDIALPRGSTSIHLFIVIGVNAGQVESDWPSGPDADDALQAIAAPRVMKPAPPTLEVRPYLDISVDPPVYRTRVEVGSRLGPRVRKVQLFRVRVDDAAKELDTMGPALATITGNGAGWTVDTADDVFGTNINKVTGYDTPAGSWKRVWYRAAAWSDPDDLRGYLGGRSGESSAAWVVIPPSDKPNLSAVTVSWPSGGAIGDVLLQWTSTVPLAKTPLGPHVLSVKATVKGAAAPLIDFTSKMDAIPSTEPAIGSGVWIIDPNAKAPRHYAAYLRRASENDPVDVIIQLTDPLGRMSEKVVRIAAGSVLPPPKLGKFQVKKIASPAGTQLLFMCNAQVNVDDPPYLLKVTAYRPLLSPVPPKFPFALSDTMKASDAIKAVTPLRTVSEDALINAAHGLTEPVIKGPIIKGAPPITIEIPVPDIPIDNDTSPPAGNDPLLLRRVPGPHGTTLGYYAFCRVSVTSFVVRLTSPDGRTDEHTEVVS